MVPRGSGRDRDVGSSATPVAELPLRRLVVLGVSWTIVILTVTYVLAYGDPASTGAQLVGSTAILAAILFCLVASVLAARRWRRARLGWALIAVGMGLGAIGQLGWVATALSESETAPSALADTLAFLGYILPTVAAIFAFPRRTELRISRYRQVLDVLVITIGVILISEATVLEAVVESTDTSTLAGWLHRAYLVADIAICALVLCLGMRQLPGDRMTWFVLGSGLLVVAISDSIYVRLLAEGGEFLTATPLAAGWMLGPVLIASATFIPMTGREVRGRDYALLLQLLPYLPVLGALVILSLNAVDRDPLLLLTAGLLLLAVTIRQVMIVYENVSLTRDLEGKVASRTAELTTLGSIVTSSTDAIVGVSRDNRITAWNPAAEKLFGHSAAEVIGQPPETLLKEAGPASADMLARAERGEELAGFEVDWRRPDDTSIPVALTISPILDSDGVQGISIFAQDITQRRREAETLERAREDALASSRLKSEFLATMSHEIRTPMNAVIGLTALLLETELDPTQRTYAEGVQSAGGALLSVIDDILDISKLEAGKVVLDQQDFSPRQLVEEVGALMAPAASAKGLELIAYCLPDVPAAVHGDSGRIRQILLNLASNAVKFTPQGEVIIKVAAVGGDRERTRLRFDVIDTGIGIAVKDQSRLFESFSQADASTTRRFGGTGLGLAISRRLVEVMGGTIAVESEVDVGSVFSVELSLRTANRPEPSGDEFGHDLLVGLRVLVVDDNATNRTLLKSQLESWQLQVALAEDAPRAFSLLRSAALQGQPYDIVALDANMPEVDGLDLARRITADPVLEGSAMIMLTSGLYPEPRTMREAGITQWLPKPIRSEELFDRLMRLVGPREHELQVRREYAAAGQPHGDLVGQVLVIDDQPVSRIVVKRLLFRLGFDVRCVSDGRESVELLQQAAYSAVLVNVDSPGIDAVDIGRTVRQVEGPGRGTPVVAMITRSTTEERERCLRAGIEHLVSRPLDTVTVGAVLASVARPTPTGQTGDVGGSDGATDDRTIDPSRLEDLAELAAPDGSSLMVTMVESFARRSADRTRALREAVASGDRESVLAIAHELKGASGTIGAQRVMSSAADIEQRARRGEDPSAESVTALITELQIAVRELTDLVAPPR